MNTNPLCPECGAELAPGDARGLCPRCLFKHGLGTQPEPGAKADETTGPVRRHLPEAGEEFGRYRVICPLGRGGMGVVFEAEEQDTGRRVALKVLGQQLDSPEHRARFLREGRLAASINHPNSVYVFGTEEIDGTPTIAMELVAGGTLDQRVKKRGPMPASAAVDAILQIIAGLEAAQAIGILHRDIKPGNCFEDTDGTIKIGDFGLSISTAPRADTAVTAAGTMVGTPAFCSPEQLRGEELNARSDMYSVGVTLFYLLTGNVPFEGHNLAQLTANVLEKRAPSPRAFRKDIPPGLAKAVLRCLEKQPSERFKSYDELRQALAPYTSAAPTPATLGLRFLAGALDMLILCLVGWVVMLACFGNLTDMMNRLTQRSPGILWWMLGGLCVGMLYYAVTEGYWGATLGKAICRLRVIGPDNSPPGLWRASVRMFFYMVLPALPYWIVNRGDPFAYLQVPTFWQYAMQLSFYVVLAALFCTVRRRNGFAAVHDLVTQTRVIARAALRTRPILVLSEAAPAALEGKTRIGPYHVLESLGRDGEVEWSLGYDLRLLRKVWIRTVPPGTPAVPVSWRTLGRVGRLRWLTGRRSPEENWDAFEGVTGRPLLHLIAAPAAQPQPWSQVRFWVHDLANEIAAAEKDGTLPPELSLDRVWITGEGRAKLLDFTAPGLGQPDERSGGSAERRQFSSVQSASLFRDAATSNEPRFLQRVATAALTAQPQGRSEPSVPLPLHARDFLKQLPRFADASAVLTALTPLLHRIATVSRARRTAVVAGCLVLPLLMGALSVSVFSLIKKLYQENPGLLQLSMLLQQRTAFIRIGKPERLPSEAQYEVFIATNFRSVITNEASWNSPFALALIKGDLRRFAEQSVASHPAPTEQEIADAEAALKPYKPSANANAFTGPFDDPQFPLLVGALMLVMYVAIPALIAALLFRGGLVLRIANVTFVRRDGERASRLRVFWRGLITWSPLVVLMLLGLFASVLHRGKPTWFAPIALVILGSLAVLSVVLPKRGVPDRLAGTWPVPR